MEKTTLKIYLSQSAALDFWQSCQDDKLQKFCTACPKYGNCWSCPPLKKTWKDFPKGQIYLIGAQLSYPPELLEKDFTPQALAGFCKAHLTPLKNKIARALICLEGCFPQSASLSSGGCELCPKCSRPLKKSCQKPKEMRYSIDALGVDMGKCAAQFLGVPLCWGEKGQLPRYHLLIHAFLSDAKIPLEKFSPALLASLKAQGSEAPLITYSRSR